MSDKQVTLFTTAINADVDGDQTVLTLPGLKPDEQIVIVGYMLSINLAGTISVRTTDNTFGFEITDPGASYPGTADAPALVFPEGKNVEINNPAGVDCNGHVTWYVE